MASSQAEHRGPERRRSFRFINRQPPAATLEIGHKRVPALILDESTEGFSVLMEQDLGVQVGDVLRLRTETTIDEVRVANVGREAHGRRYRIGLQRLRELEVLGSPVPKIPWLVRWFRSDPAVPGQSMVGATLLIGVLVIAAPLLATGLFFALSRAAAEPAADWIVPERASGSDGSSDPVRRFLLGQRDPGAPEPSSRRAPSSTRISHTPGSQLQAIAESLPGAAALLVPEVAERLTLTIAQRQRLRELTEATEAALEQIERTAPDDSRKERARKRNVLFTEARKQALELLTPPQRAAWEALAAGKAP